MRKESVQKLQTEKAGISRDREQENGESRGNRNREKGKRIGTRVGD